MTGLEHLFNRSIARDKPGPASSCPHCFADGTVHHDQTTPRPAAQLGSTNAPWIRFTCPSKHVWTTPAAEARLHGEFLKRIEHVHTKENQ